MDAVSMVKTKRGNSRPHTTEELEWWISEYSAGRIPEYQMAAWLMAVCWRGMTAEETATLTKCMVLSGTKIEWPVAAQPFLVDKHSTGGVGDKVSLVLAPLVAALGVRVPMMAGRGLGHTGGTIDKLESIPGYRTDLSIPEFQDVVQTVGCSIVSASKELCPADRRLYALRDVTATVSSVPLQTSSILCKKIAEHPSSLVLDVKYGAASFQATQEQAIELAVSMIATAEANGLRPTTCFLTHMDSVLGATVGNWLEVVECLRLLKGTDLRAPNTQDLLALVLLEGAQMLQQSPVHGHRSLDDLAGLCLETLASGAAYAKFEEMVVAHGGDAQVCKDPEQHPPHPPAQFQQDLLAPRSGYLEAWDGRLLGELAVQLGAGRSLADEPVDPMAGIEVFHKGGGASPVEAQNTVLVRLHTNKSPEVLARAADRLLGAVRISDQPPPAAPFVVSHIVTSAGGVRGVTVPSCLSAAAKDP